LAIYVDAPYRVVPSRDGDIVATHPADYSLVGVFLGEVARHFHSVELLGRTQRAPEVDHFVPLPPHLRLVALPDYGDLLQFGRLLKASRGTLSCFWRSLARVDTVLVFGPHPFGLAFAILALARRRRVVLGVRQDTLSYFRARLPSRRWAPALLGVQIIDVANRLLARRVRTIVAGREIARRYGGPSGRVLVMADSVVRADDVAPGPAQRDWSGAIGLVTVGRIDPEKNPLLLVEVLAELNRLEPGRFLLTWVGGGPLEGAVRARARKLGVEPFLDLRGWLPFGPEVLALYRAAHAFVHVSLTEGAPRVLVEALASATPIVATDVGGVAAALDDGGAALLVPPRDRDALVTAIRRLADEAELRARLVERGLELARERTLEAQAARVAAFVAGRQGAAPF
jgi:glycosyltransferase involved in cell wall biosynthesis